MRYLSVNGQLKVFRKWSQRDFATLLLLKAKSQPRAFQLLRDGDRTEANLRRLNLDVQVETFGEYDNKSLSGLLQLSPGAQGKAFRLLNAKQRTPEAMVKLAKEDQVLAFAALEEKDRIMTVLLMLPDPASQSAAFKQLAPGERSMSNLRLLPTIEGRAENFQYLLKGDKTLQNVLAFPPSYQAQLFKLLKQRTIVDLAKLSWPARKDGIQFITPESHRSLIDLPDDDIEQLLDYVENGQNRATLVSLSSDAQIWAFRYLSDGSVEELVMLTPECALQATEYLSDTNARNDFQSLSEPSRAKVIHFLVHGRKIEHLEPLSHAERRLALRFAPPAAANIDAVRSLTDELSEQLDLFEQLSDDQRTIPNLFKLNIASITMAQRESLLPILSGSKALNQYSLGIPVTADILPEDIPRLPIDLRPDPYRIPQRLLKHLGDPYMIEGFVKVDIADQGLAFRKVDLDYRTVQNMFRLAPKARGEAFDGLRPNDKHERNFFRLDPDQQIVAYQYWAPELAKDQAGFQRAFAILRAMPLEYQAQAFGYLPFEHRTLGNFRRLPHEVRAEALPFLAPIDQKLAELLQDEMSNDIVEPFTPRTPETESHCLLL